MLKITSILFATLTVVFSQRIQKIFPADITDGNCDETFSCNGTDVDATNINCRGFASCVESGLTAEASIYCSGQRACTDATIDGAASFFMTGMYGFAGGSAAADVWSTSGYRICSGGLSCYDTTMYTYKADGTGYKALGSSTLYGITNGATFLVRSGWGAYNAVWYSNGMQWMSFYFQGYQSGYQTTIYCQGTATCIIYCYYGTCAEGETTVIVSPGAQVQQNCAWTTTPCVTITTASEDEAAAYIETRKQKQEEDKAITFDDIHGMYEPYSSITSDITTGCSYEHCCQWENSCDDSTFTSFADATCRGYDSCTSVTMSGWSGWASCWGDSSCHSATISNGPNLQCHGPSSCWGSTVTDVNNIYVSGAGLGASVINNPVYLVSSTSGSLQGATINVNTRSATIKSYGQNFKSININVDGQTADIWCWNIATCTGATITCTNGATCTVHCMYAACENANFYCDSSSMDNCNVDCLAGETSSHCATLQLQSSNIVSKATFWWSKNTNLFTNAGVILFVVFILYAVYYHKKSSKNTVYQPIGTEYGSINV